MCLLTLKSVLSVENSSNCWGWFPKKLRYCSAGNNSRSLNIVRPKTLKISGPFHIMVGHDDRTSHQHILSYLLQGVVGQHIMSGPFCKMSDQKEDLKGRLSCE